MKAAAKRSKESHQSKANAYHVGQQRRSHGVSFDSPKAFTFEDKRPEAVAQRKLHALVQNSPQVQRLKAIQEMADKSVHAQKAAQMGNNSVQMYAQVEKPRENKSRAVAHSVTQKKSSEKQGCRFTDNRPAAKSVKILQKVSRNRLRGSCENNLVPKQVIQKYEMIPLNNEGKKKEAQWEKVEMFKGAKMKDHILVRELGSGHYVFGIKRKINPYNQKVQAQTFNLFGGNRPKNTNVEDSLKKEMEEESALNYELMSHEYVNSEMVGEKSYQSTFKGLVKKTEPEQKKLMEIPSYAMENDYLWKVSIQEIMDHNPQSKEDVGNALMEIYKKDCDKIGIETNFEEVEKVLKTWHTHDFLQKQILEDIRVYMAHQNNLINDMFENTNKIKTPEMESDKGKIEAESEYEKSIKKEAKTDLFDLSDPYEQLILDLIQEIKSNNKSDNEDSILVDWLVKSDRLYIGNCIKTLRRLNIINTEASLEYIERWERIIQ